MNNVERLAHTKDINWFHWILFSNFFTDMAICNIWYNNDPSQYANLYASRPLRPFFTGLYL